MFKLARIYKGQVTVLSSWVKEYSNCVPKKSRMPVLTTLECFLSLSNKTKYLLTPDKSCIGYSSKGPAVKVHYTYLQCIWL